MTLSHIEADEIFGQLPITTKEWIVEVLAELEMAKINHPNFPVDPIHQAAIVAEESGELVRAALQFKYEKGPFFHMHKEAVQTCAMALRFLTNQQATARKPLNIGELNDTLYKEARKGQGAIAKLKSLFNSKRKA